MSDGDKDSRETLAGELIPAQPAGVFKRRRFRLTSANGVRRELAAVYGEFRNQQIDADRARTAAFILRCLLESMRVDEIERRLTDLEKRL